MTQNLPNIIFVFPDQLRYQSLGYTGDENAITPFIDQFSKEAIDISQAISGCSMCSSYRAGLLTGKNIFGHGLILNDMEMVDPYPSIAQEFKLHGYKTAYIGKWHVYGSPDGNFERRSHYVPEDSQLGFDYWKGAECSHNYMKSPYFFGADPEAHYWDGYDAISQTKDAISFLAQHDKKEPLLLMLSWGPPHDPYELVPDKYYQLFREKELKMRPNIPKKFLQAAQKNLRGYYSHIKAIDDCMKSLVDRMKDLEVYNESIIVFTSDHGDMHYSQGLKSKMHPFDESVRVPFLIKLPKSWNIAPSKVPIPLDAQDIFPTLLGLIGRDLPPEIQGKNWSQYITGKQKADGSEFGILTMPIQYHELWRYNIKPYRGIRSNQYTFVMNKNGPWLLFDNVEDPYQMNNLIYSNEASSKIKELSKTLRLELLINRNDAFLDSMDYVELYGVHKHHNRMTTGKQKDWQYYWNQAGSIKQ